MTELIAIGECLVELMSDEPIDRARTFTKGFGGDTCDAAIMATRLGTKCGYVTRVGNDPFGDYLIREWRASKLDISAVARTDAYTGLFISPLQTSESKDIFYYRSGSAGSRLQPLTDLKSQRLPRFGAYRSPERRDTGALEVGAGNHIGGRQESSRRRSASQL